MPRFKIVSIMPGMETRAPLRTETSSGSLLSPNFFPFSFSSQRSASKICSLISLEILRPDL